MTVLTAMVLCAGFGSRLRPLTDELPKPLVPLGDRPLLMHILEQLWANGVKRALINTHHLPHHFEALVRAAPIPVEILHEASLLGTAGGVAQAQDRIGSGPVVVWNGDTLLKPDLAPLLSAQRESDLSLLVSPAAAPGTQGSVGVAGERVARVRGEVFGEVTREANYVGIMAISAKLLAELPKAGCLIGDFVLPRLRAGHAIFVAATEAEWNDVGTARSYWQTNLNWLAANVEKGESWFGAGVQIEANVDVVRSVVGERARVLGAGRLENCVVWPGGVAVAPLSNAIVTSRGQVVQL